MFTKQKRRTFTVKYCFYFIDILSFNYQKIYPSMKNTKITDIGNSKKISDINK